MEEREYYRMDIIENSHWWFVAKRKFLGSILDRFGEKQGLRALDVGCGTGAVMKFLEERGYTVEGVDCSDLALEFCRKKKLTVINGSAESLPYPDNSFDIMTALDVLEHVADDKQVVREIYRVLKPGGIFIATVPAHQFLFSGHDKALHHHRRYSKDQFKESLGSSFVQLSYIGWIHATILLPALAMRIFRRYTKDSENSDVRPSNKIVSMIMSVAYIPERLWFRCMKLPWGLSLIGVVKK